MAARVVYTLVAVVSAVWAYTVVVWRSGVRLVNGGSPANKGWMRKGHLWLASIGSGLWGHSCDWRPLPMRRCAK